MSIVYAASTSVPLSVATAAAAESRSELDSHANMVVLGRNCFVFDDIDGKCCDVAPFDPSLGISKSVPIVDAALVYTCPFSLRVYLLVVRNALYVPTLGHNLIPPFLLSEAGVVVNPVPKIHTADPSEDDHSLYFPEHKLRIPLKLNGTFSYFPTRSPIAADLQNIPVLFITPDSNDWNPYAEHFASNEAAMLDSEGYMVQSKYQKKMIMDHPHSDNYHISDVSVPRQLYENAVDAVLGEAFSSLSLSEESSVYPDINGARRDTESFASAICSNVAVSHFADSLGVLPSEIQDGSPFFGHVDDFAAQINSTQASKPHSVTPEFLSNIWNIKRDQAASVLKQTTHLNRQGADNDLSRQFSTNDRMLRYKRIQSQFFTDTFFVTKTGKSTRGNTCCQIFVSDKGFVAIYPMKSKSEFPDALHLFCKEIGVPVDLIVDPSGEQTSAKVKRFCNQVGTTLRVLEESTQWANRAELYVGLFKESIREDIRSEDCPLRLWDYCAERRALIHNLTPRNLFQLNGNNPLTATFGDQGDISNLCRFGWYSWCYFRVGSGSDKFPYQKKALGRVLGPCKNEGNAMTQNILQSNGIVVGHRSVRPLSVAEINNPSEKRLRAEFDANIRKKLGSSILAVEDDVKKTIKAEEASHWDMEDFIEHDAPPDSVRLLPEDPLDSTGTPVFEQPFYDHLIHAEVQLAKDDTLHKAEVQGRSKDRNGNVVGTYDSNPMLNSVLYDVKFPDGAVRQYAANTIAQNIYDQVDGDGYSSSTLQSVLDCKRDSTAVSKEDRYVYTRSGQRRYRHTTAGWKFLVRFNDGDEHWVPLKLLKETNPVEIAEYVTAKNLSDEAAFIWWVPFTLRKRDRIIAGVNARIRKQHHKYGIEVPNSVADAKRIDSANRDTFWQDAIELEMSNLACAFRILDKDEPAPVGWTKSSGHFVFDVKMDFTRKARWVKDGHRHADPIASTYAGVVSRESVRIALTYAALNDITVTCADVMNAFLQAPSSEQHYVVCGPEFGLEHVGKKALIVRALYGGKTSGADFWKHLRSCMKHLGFDSCPADPDIWMREVQKDNGDTYWEYVLLYCDDCLVVSMNGENLLREELGRFFVLKEKSIGPPSIYLGNKVSKVTLDNGIDAWSFSSSQYVQSAVKNVEEYLAKSNQSLPKRANAPFRTDYRPETDVSEELDPIQAAYFQSLIGILRWIVELGRIDINTECSMLASCMALPRVGHLNQCFHVFAFLKKYHNAELVLDPTEPVIDPNVFPQEDWSHSPYGDCTEDLPPNAPKPRGRGVIIRAYVDSDHAGDSITRRSRTGFIIYLNNAPIYWCSQKQGSCETSSFASEFIAMKSCCEYIRGVRYKLRMMGISCTLPAFVLGDNKSVLVNSANPYSQLKKKSCSIAYHFVREGCAKDEWRVAYIKSENNPADILTKPIAGGEKRTKLSGKLLHYIAAALRYIS